MGDSFNLTLKQKAIIAIMILVATIPPIISSYHQSDEEFWLEHHLKSKYSGVIASKYLNKNNHMANTVKFESGKTTTHFHDYFDELEIGDSLVKDIHSVYLYIYRDGNLKAKKNFFKLQLSYQK